MITICFVYFRCLTLAHLEAALYSLRQQDFACFKEIFVLDNNSLDSAELIQKTLDSLAFPVPITLRSYKHGDLTKTHSWSTNIAVSEVTTPWVFFTRADYLLAPGTLRQFAAVRDGFVTSRGCHLNIDIAECDQRPWRQYGAQMLETLGTVYDYTCIDSGVWMTRKAVFDSVGGLDESLTAWGHAQTHFQWKLHNAGVQCHQLNDVLFFHPQHGGEKNMDLAHQQLAQTGVDLRVMWARYAGPRVY